MPAKQRLGDILSRQEVVRVVPPTTGWRLIVSWIGALLLGWVLLMLFIGGAIYWSDVIYFRYFNH